MEDAAHALGCFTFSRKPTMSPTLPPGGEGFCVRDTLWQLFQWPASGPDWERFPEWAEEFDSLIDYLGLSTYQLTGDQGVMDIVSTKRHPGLAVFEFPDEKKAHVVYVHSVEYIPRYWDRRGCPTGDLRTQGQMYGWPLPNQYWGRRVRFPCIIVDENQPAHPLT